MFARDAGKATVATAIAAGIGILLAALPPTLAVAADGFERLPSEALAIEAELVGTRSSQRAGDFLTTGFDAVWMASAQGLVRVDLSDNHVTSIAIDGALGKVLADIEIGAQGLGGGITTGGGYVWISRGGTPVVQIDPATNTTLRIYGGVGLGGAIRFAGDSLWVSGERALYRIKPPG